MINKNDKFTLKCVDYSYLGLGVVKQDGFCVFVKGMLKDEVGEIQITSLKKDYGYGRVLALTTKSDQRVESICPYFPKCGGCQLLYMSYQEQLSFKQGYVEEVMKKIGKIKIDALPIIGMQDPIHYRNKVQIPVETIDDKLIGGFYRTNSHDIIPIDNCLLQSDLSNEVYRKIIQLLNKYEVKDIVKHVLIKHAFASDQLMVVFIINQKQLPHISEMVTKLKKEERIKSIIININKRNDNVILGDKEFVVYGDDHIEDVLMGYKFHISSKSFYQVNSVQTALLYQTAYDLANIQPNENILDLYCGIGTIGIIASKYANKVIGVEIIEEAIKDAQNNALINNVTNTEFICGDVATATQQLITNNQHIDVVFVDPPRKGCDDQTIEAITKLQPQRIIYISCNPSTLARDLSIFETKGYQTTVIQPVDMFPNTYHVENVVLLTMVK